MRYEWVRVIITTENRDRRGGHGPVYAKDGMGYEELWSPEGAKFQKRKQRRKQRRQANKIKQEALNSYYMNLEEDRMDMMMWDEMYENAYEEYCLGDH